MFSAYKLHNKQLPRLFALTAAVLFGLPPPAPLPESFGSIKNSRIRSETSSLLPFFSKSSISHTILSCLTSNFSSVPSFFLYSSESFLNSNPLNFLMFFLMIAVLPGALNNNLCNSFKSSFLNLDMDASILGISPNCVPFPWGISTLP